MCLAVLGAGPAAADIAAFNAAVKAGDYKAAAAAAADTWPTLKQSDPQIAIVAREFAWATMLAGDPKSAKTYAGFLIQPPQELGPRDPTPAVSKVLNAWIDYAIKPTKEARAALIGALIARAGTPGRDLISVRAAQALVSDNLADGRWQEAAEAASTGMSIVSGFGGDMSDTGLAFELDSLSASFVANPAVPAAMQLRQLTDRVLDAALAAKDPDLHDRLTRIFYSAKAWAEVSTSQLTQNRKTIEPYQSRNPGDKLTPAPGDASLPACEISRAPGGRTPAFPAAGKFSGWPGFATYRLKVAPDGRFTDAQVIGIAPHEEFGATAGKALEDWRWTFKTAVRPPSCRMPEYYYIDLEFQVGR
ncbi:MAG TPA: hypothetical protein VG942_05665 [Hyphomonadaceae bacterium]|nr:hypothetical protein [Hyphomonadaceae bacterium]